MKQVTVNVREEQYDFFLEFCRQLGIEVPSEEPEVPEWQKEIVRERIRTAKPEDMIPWKEARKQIRFKSQG